MDQSSEAPSDARWGTRLSIDRTVHVRAGGVERPATMQDLSLTGCFVVTASTYAIGTILSLRFELDGEASRNVTTEARVVRRTPTGVGVRFVFTDPQTPAAIKRWISSRRSD
jgi:hypothetical protein